MNTSGKKFLGILIGISALLLIIASLGDLQISKMVMDQNSIFGNLFQIFVILECFLSDTCHPVGIAINFNGSRHFQGRSFFLYQAL